MSTPKEKADWDVVKSDPEQKRTPAKLDYFMNEVIRLLRKIAGE